MWLTYLSGLARSRAFASSISSSRSPNFVAPVGQTVAQAVANPAAIRSLQSVHAIAAAHALIFVVQDWAIRRLNQRPNRTHGRARRCVAVHAHLANEPSPATIYHRVSLR